MIKFLWGEHYDWNFWGSAIDLQGRITLKEKVKLGKIRRALVTILDDEVERKNESMVGSVEIINDDSESGSREVANLFNKSLER